MNHKNKVPNYFYLSPSKWGRRPLQNYSMYQISLLLIKWNHAPSVECPKDVKQTVNELVIFPAPPVTSETPYIRYWQSYFYSYGNFTPILPSVGEPHGWQADFQLNSFPGNTQKPSSQLPTTSLIPNFPTLHVLYICQDKCLRNIIAFIFHPFYPLSYW